MVNDTLTAADIDSANAVAVGRMLSATPTVIDVRCAGECIPGFAPNLILTSGAPLPWHAYQGGQRAALIGGALYEGLAASEPEAVARFEAGEILIGACHDHGCVGSVAGIYTASMPVFVVRNTDRGNLGYCNLYEGKATKRLNYGVYDDDVRTRLDVLRDVVAPVLGRAIRSAGGIALKPLMQRALNMGDELHSRNTAASYLFMDKIFPHLLDVEVSKADLKQTLALLTEDNYFFLRLTMAASKVTADAAAGVKGSTLVTVMALNCKAMAIRLSGLGSEWISGPTPTVEAKLFDGFTEDDIAWMGGESSITETIGLGGFAQAAAFPLQEYQGGSPEFMIARNLEMYEITLAENDVFKIPYLKFRGTPTGIDLRKVIATGIAPVINAGIGGKNGGQIGAGMIRVPVECFEQAADAFAARYGIDPRP